MTPHEVQTLGMLQDHDEETMVVGCIGAFFAWYPYWREADLTIMRDRESQSRAVLQSYATCQRGDLRPTGPDMLANEADT